MKHLRTKQLDRVYSLIAGLGRSTLLVLLFVPASCAGASGSSASDLEDLRCNGPIEGTFLQFSGLVNSWSEDELRREIQYAYNVGMKTIIVQWTGVVHNGKIHTLYQSPRYQKQQNILVQDPIGVILDKAGELGMKVHLGLAHDADWWTKAFDPEWLRWKLELNKELADDLYATYANRSSLAGFYIPDEIFPPSWFSPDKRGLLAQFLEGLASHVRSKDPALKISIAPFFDARSSYGTYADFYSFLLDHVALDIVWSQDGIGCDRGISIRHAASYFEALNPVFKDKRVEHWADLEIFVMNRSESGYVFGSAPLSRIVEQIDAERSYVDGIVVFEFSHYMSPQGDSWSAELYREYVDWVIERNQNWGNGIGISETRGVECVVVASVGSLLHAFKKRSRSWSAVRCTAEKTSSLCQTNRPNRSQP